MSPIDFMMNDGSFLRALKSVNGTTQEWHEHELYLDSIDGRDIYLAPGKEDATTQILGP